MRSSSAHLRRLSILVAAAAVGTTMLACSPDTAPEPAADPSAQAAVDGSGSEEEEGEEESKGKRRSGTVEPAVVAAPPDGPVVAPAGPAGDAFSPQVRLGYTAGDQWEPAIAADRSGHVYVLYAQYLGVPDCPLCLSPTQVVQVSADGGVNWDPPKPIGTSLPEEEPARGWDSQITVDPVDGTTVWAAWLEKDKSDIAVARSGDFGATWTIKTVDMTNAGTDKPILAVRGEDIYVAYNHTQTNWVSSSHDGGDTWESVKVQPTGKGKLGWSLASGGTVTPNGDVHFSWSGYEQNGVAKGPVNLFVSTSTDGGTTWRDTVVDVSGSPPDCSADLCGWAYLGAQIALASDAEGTLYALWNAGPNDTKRAPERIWFARSTDGGATWSTRQEVSTAAAGVAHAFPAIAAEADGTVRIAWMDARAPGGSLWNVYYRSSTDGGATWSPEADISSYVTGYDYILPDGFEFPFGDYFELAIDGAGATHAVFGEGLNYDTPGSIWYTRGN